MGHSKAAMLTVALLRRVDHIVGTLLLQREVPAQFPDHPVIARDSSAEARRAGRAECAYPTRSGGVTLWSRMMTCERHGRLGQRWQRELP